MEFVKYQQEGFVGVVTIDRPKALNALNSQVLEELDKIFDAVDLQKTRVIVLTGAGEKSFVAGADIAEMYSLSQKEAEEFGRRGNKIFRKIETFPIPVIAAINGFVLGGGCEIAMSCDIRICSDNALFGQPEVGLGITPGFGGTQRLARLIGQGKAKEVIFACKNMKAEEAFSVGLVNAVYPLVDLMPEAMKLANKIAKNAPIAVRMCKEAINGGYDLAMDEAVDLESKLFAQCFETEDQREGMKAFLEKRKVEGFNNK
ncbi:MAG TPA: enoyl-CoA hydratase-related protein [Fusobacterium sp.]|uniref:enoyl-CoA hydratase-related protein n=1 Tax=Fusobacterium sp. TaxID=68766 RepID=UPI002F3E24E0